MTASTRMSGVLCPVVTPFDAELTPDARRLAAHCRWLLEAGVGLALFGTNSEANSLSVPEKIALFDSLCDEGLDPARMLPGTGACALTDAVTLCRHVTAAGAAGCLMLPPFYYKAITDDGLFAFFSEVIERVADERLRLYLYHIPPVAQVGIPLDVIERLLTRYPAVIAGIKDSSGDWTHTQAVLDRQWDDFRVFVGSESLLLANLRAGGAGCISATANVNPAAITALYENWRSDDADVQQSALNRVRDIIQARPMIASMKALIETFGEAPGYRTVRPPLTALSDSELQALVSELEETGFAMAGLAEALNPD